MVDPKDRDNSTVIKDGPPFYVFYLILFVGVVVQVLWTAFVYHYWGK